MAVVSSLDSFQVRAARWSTWLRTADSPHPAPPTFECWPGDEATPLARTLLRAAIARNNPRFLRPLLAAFAGQADALVSPWMRPYLASPAAATPVLRRQVLALARAGAAMPSWSAALGAHAHQACDEEMLAALCQGDWLPARVDDCAVHVCASSGPTGEERPRSPSRCR